MTRTKLKELMMFGSANLAAGMFFAAGYIIIEHTDNSWFPSDDTVQTETKSPQKVAASSTND